MAVPVGAKADGWFDEKFDAKVDVVVVVVVVDEKPERNDMAVTAR